jgi:hypothetical protein
MRKSKVKSLQKKIKIKRISAQRLFPKRNFNDLTYTLCKNMGNAREIMENISSILS